MPAKKASGRSSSKANHVGVLRGLVSAYSQKELNGTTQRCSTFSQDRQCGLAVLRKLVIGASPNRGGPGMRQRASMSSRTPSAALRTIGAGLSGKHAGLDWHQQHSYSQQGAPELSMKVSFCTEFR